MPSKTITPEPDEIVALHEINNAIYTSLDLKKSLYVDLIVNKLQLILLSLP